MSRCPRCGALLAETCESLCPRCLLTLAIENERSAARAELGRESSTVDGELPHLARYEIVRELGEGGMGRVFLAYDPKLRREVCIKLLKVDEPAGAELSHRILREARAASALAHPNVAQIYEVGQEEGLSYIAMEYVEGEPLDRRLAHSPVPVDEAVEIVAQVADALVEAGARGIVHRDIKPANIVMTRRGVAKVLDFGLATLEPTAHLLGAATTMDESRPGAIVGTVRYMSPEQALGGTVDHRSDLFSLGVVLYELLAGRRPFEADTVGEVFRKLISESPPPLSMVVPKIPATLERIVGRCLEREPDRRYATAGELLADLRKLQQAKVVLPAGIAVASRRGRRLAGVAALVLLMALAFEFDRRREESAALGAIGSIAVLPLANMGGAATEFLSDGLTESLIGELSRVGSLRVMARSTVFRFRDSTAPVVDIGKRLGVETVLVGELTPAPGDRLKVRAELVRVADGARLWAQDYDRRKNDLLGMQREVATEIASSLERTLVPDAVERSSPGDSEAYPLYLEGRFYWNQRTPQALERALTLFGKALEVDPDFALAYTGEADTYALLERYMSLPSSESRALAQRAAERALQLDDDLPEAYISQASLYTTYDWNWSGAERAFRRALELSPSSATAHHWYGLLLARLGRHDEARRELETALQLDPLSAIMQAAAANVAFYGRRYEDSIAACGKALDLEPGFAPALLQNALSLSFAGRDKEAVSSVEALLRGAAENPVVLATAGSVLGRAGRLAASREIANKLASAGSGEASTGYLEAAVWASLGARERALEGLERAEIERSNWMGFVAVDPAFDALTEEPRFQALVRRVGLAP